MMKNFTVLLATFLLGIGVYAQEADCSKEVLEGGGSAWGQLHEFIFASDFKVDANETFNLTNLKFNAITAPGFIVEGVTLYFYEDTGSGPGTQLGTQQISTFEIIPIGEYAGLDHSTISLNLNDAFQFQGSADGTTTYWVGVIIDFPEDQMSFIEVTEIFDTDNATYFYDNESDMWIAGDSPFWPLGGFEHAMISLYGNCETLGITSVETANFMHYAQNGQLTIKSENQIQEVQIYNAVGQQIISQKVNSTTANININPLKPGIYFAQMSIDGKRKNFKFVVK